MARPGTKLALLTSCALIFAAPELTAQSGSVLSDLSNPEVQARYRAEAAKRIACPPIAGYDALMAAYAANATSKWDRAAMGCALEYGAEAMKELSLPKNLGWALATFRTDNIETHLGVFGAHLDYFEVLDNSYSDHYQGIEMSAELGLRWEQTRARAEVLLARIDPAGEDTPAECLLPGLHPGPQVEEQLQLPIRRRIAELCELIGRQRTARQAQRVTDLTQPLDVDTHLGRGCHRQQRRVGAM